MHCMHVPLYYLSGCTEPAAHGLGAYAAAAALLRRVPRALPLGGRSAAAMLSASHSYVFAATAVFQLASRAVSQLYY